MSTARYLSEQANADMATGAMDLLKRMGWGPSSRLSPHSVCQLMERYAEEEADKLKLRYLDVEDGAEAISEENTCLRARTEGQRAALLMIESYAGNDPRCEKDAILWKIYTTARAALKD